MRFSTLDDWLRWQETLHPSAIELGLERVGEVADRLGLRHPPQPVITVAGTNGKGSSVALLEACLKAGGYRVGAYTSPHLLRYNERIRIGAEPVSDQVLCEAFERIDQARGDISLSYFEFGTLAALDIFARGNLDVAVLEVGLGGRLDAVNVIDADVALVTAVALDHADWLGDDREIIGREKAGILRAGRPAVCSDPCPPRSLIEQAASLGAALYRYAEDYRPVMGEGQWRWEGPQGVHYDALPLPALRGRCQIQNAAGVMMVLHLLSDRLPLSRQAIRDGLHSVRLSGRLQRLPGEVEEFLDVAHNPQAAEELAVNLQLLPAAGRTHAVLAMLADKDIAGVVTPLIDAIDRWYVTGLDVPRGAGAEQLEKALREAGAKHIELFADVDAARRAAHAAAGPGERIVTFGSFYTVAAALARSI